MADVSNQVFTFFNTSGNKVRLAFRTVRVGGRATWRRIKVGIANNKNKPAEEDVTQVITHGTTTGADFFGNILKN